MYSNSLIALLPLMMEENLNGVLKKSFFLSLYLTGSKLSNNKVSFLDLLIQVQNNQFLIQVSDKRDGFPFFIVRMPFLRSNIPSKIFYSTYGSEIFRTVRTTSSKFIFSTNSKKLITRICKQCGRIKTLLVHWLKFLEGSQTFWIFVPNFLQFYKFLNKTIVSEPFYKLIVFCNRSFLNKLFELIHLMTFRT